MRRLSALLLALALLGILTGIAVSADSTPSDVGDAFNSWPNDNGVAGLAFVGRNLWGVSIAGVLYEIDSDTGDDLSMMPISPSPTTSIGLGHDPTRGVFIVTDPTDDLILIVDDQTGVVLGSASSPGGRPNGATYDSFVDGYWITDSSTQTIDLVDADTLTFVSGRSCPVPDGNPAGAAFEASIDRVYVNGHQTAMQYGIDTSDCSVLIDFPIGNSGSGVARGVAFREDDETSFSAHLNRIIGYDTGSGSEILCKGSVVTILGTVGSDTLIGTAGNDVIAALDGDDIIAGLGGNDLICAGYGKDRVFGVSGLNRIYGNKGIDLIIGGTDADSIYGGADTDLIVGGDGNDIINGDSGIDIIVGGNGDDDLFGDDDTDIFACGPGVDTADGGAGFDFALPDCETIVNIP